MDPILGDYLMEYLKWKRTSDFNGFKMMFA